jgi:REP element-mobilizing transposase RayT
MPQSLSKVILHIIFSTKNREPWLESNVRPRVHAYLATICRDLVHVGGVADHVHIVTILPRTISQAQLIEQIKKTFSTSLPSTLPPRPASGERIEVRGIRTFRKTR